MCNYTQTIFFCQNTRPLPAGAVRALAAFRDWLAADDVIFGSAGAAVTARPEDLILFPFRHGPEGPLVNGGLTPSFLRIGEPEGSIHATGSLAASFRKWFSPDGSWPTCFSGAGKLRGYWFAAFTTSASHNS